MDVDSITEAVFPAITKMIRFDHVHVLTTFHRYQIDSAPAKKEAVVGVICRALEIHATLEEEIFYPAMAQMAADSELVEKSVAEHAEMKRLIAELRTADASEPSYDQKVYQLMRDVMHHVADEETRLLPDAELLLAGKLGQLGAAMTKRRLQLLGPNVGEVAVNTVRAFPAASLLTAIGAGVLVAHVIGAKKNYRPR